jgi:tRNA G18 (ribose-2'-O)-methylase SpoU
MEGTALAFAAGAASVLVALRLCGGAAVVAFRPTAVTSLETTAQLGEPESLDDPADPLRRVRKCEAVIRRRSSRVVVVLERCNQSHNYSAVLRTAEALGYHHIWLIAPPKLEPVAATRQGRKKVWEDDQAELEEHVAYARSASKWLSLRFFDSSEECVAALREAGREIWVTDLSQAAVCLTSEKAALPRSMAIVMGTESTGASPTMLAAADRRVYLPLHGWADSLNLSVAAAMFLQRLIDVDDTVVGDMAPEERAALRQDWYPKMARNGDTEEETRCAQLAAEGGVEPFGDLRRVDKHRAGWQPPKIRKKNLAKGQVDGIGYDTGHTATSGLAGRQ